MKTKSINKGENMKEKTNKTTIAIIILAVLLVAAVTYIGIDTYNKSKTTKENQIFNTGTQIGAQNTITFLFQRALTCELTPISVQNQTINLIPPECVTQQIFKQALTCQALPITVGNQTINMIAVECLQKQAAQQ